MTPSLTPGFQLTDNLSLTEELPAPPAAAYRVWFALNAQLGQIVVIKIYADGRIEPVDNKPTAMNPPVAAAPPIRETTPTSGWNSLQPVPSPYVPPTQVPRVPPYNPPAPTMPYGQSQQFGSASSVMLPTHPPRKRNWLKYVIGAILILGGAFALYYYRRPITKYIKKVRARISAISTPRPLPPPPAPNQTSDSTAPAVELQPDTDLDLTKLPPPPIDPNETTEASTMATDTPASVSPAKNAITAQQAVRLLSRIATIPAEKHPAIFADVRQAFTNLRRASGRQSYIDSLYTVYMGRAAQSIITYQQNGDPVSKRYAVDWYKTAYVLKPSSDLQGRITRLTNRVQKKQPKPVRKSAKSNGSLFLPDPEINQ